VFAFSREETEKHTALFDDVHGWNSNAQDSY
jgi:hypothetical protein